MKNDRKNRRLSLVSTIDSPFSVPCKPSYGVFVICEGYASWNVFNDISHFLLMDREVVAR